MRNKFQFTRRLSRVAWPVACLIGLLLMAASDALAQGTPTPAPTPDPLGQSLDYYDLGLSLRYPTAWAAPRFGSGQALLSATAATATDGKLTQAAIAVRIIDPIRDFNAPKDARLGEIALAASLTGGQNAIEPGRGGEATVAGLPAEYINIRDQNADVIGQNVAFRMPDGRVAVLVGVARTAYWPDFLPVFDQVRASARLLLPDGYTSPALEATRRAFAPGKVRLAAPMGWQEEKIGEAGLAFYSPQTAGYVDNSGLRNGPAFVIQATPLNEGQTVRDGLLAVLGVRPSEADTVQTAPIQVGAAGQTVTGVQHLTFTQTAGHAVLFVAFPSLDGKMLNVIRWTTPGMLIDQVRPTLNAMLASMLFDR
jgi:hypothetical protein